MTDEDAFHFGVVTGLAAAGILQGLVFLVHGLGTWPGDTLNTSWVRGVAWVALLVPCNVCGSTRRIHVSTSPSSAGHGHHAECADCLAKEIESTRQFLEILSVTAPDGTDLGKVRDVLAQMRAQERVQ